MIRLPFSAFYQFSKLSILTNRTFLRLPRTDPLRFKWHLNHWKSIFTAPQHWTFTSCSFIMCQFQGEKSERRRKREADETSICPVESSCPWTIWRSHTVRGHSSCGNCAAGEEGNGRDSNIYSYGSEWALCFSSKSQRRPQREEPCHYNSFSIKHCLVFVLHWTSVAQWGLLRCEGLSFGVGPDRST